MQAWEHKRENPEYGISDSDGADVHQTKINMWEEDQDMVLIIHVHGVHWHRLEDKIEIRIIYKNYIIQL